MRKFITRRTRTLDDNINWPPDLHPILRRIYVHRQIQSPNELDYSLSGLLPFHLLKDIDKAVALLAQTIQAQENIIIIGDFDADGATSTTLALKVLRQLGAKHVDFKVPNRFKFGYGLTPEIVKETLALNPKLIITVDNGISSIEGVRLARELGINVLVTDHHLPGQQLPDANAIVNPNQVGDEFPSKHLAGVGVIFYVMMALRHHFRGIGWFEQTGIHEPNLAQMLDIVALGTVADVVPLDRNNRILVNQGIKRIRAGKCCAGIQALLEISNRSWQQLTSTDLAFALGPRLNAAGRLEDMSIGIACLIADDLPDARRLAQQLDSLNSERKEIEAEMQRQALSALTAIDACTDTLPFGLCLYEPTWHQGVVGILASRVKDKYHRPVIAFADSDNDEIKGSARSIPGIHIRDVLDAIATQHSGLLAKFGGHAMAAGLTIQRTNLPQFTDAFNHEIASQVTEEDLISTIASDGELTDDELTMEVAQCIRNGGPWGQAFPEPLFDGHFHVVNQRILADKHLKLVLKYPASSKTYDAIAFNMTSKIAEENTSFEGQKFNMAYKLDINEYRGNRKVQLILEYIDN